MVEWKNNASFDCLFFSITLLLIIIKISSHVKVIAIQRCYFFETRYPFSQNTITCVIMFYHKNTDVCTTIKKIQLADIYNEYYDLP